MWAPLNPADNRAKDAANFSSDVAMKRSAQPEEPFPTYVVLASPVRSSDITGEMLPVLDGGE